MTYEEFVAELQEKLRERLPEKFEIRRELIRKNNGTLKDSLLIRRNGGSVTPAVSLQDPYRKQTEGTSVEQIVQDLLPALSGGEQEMVGEWVHAMLKDKEQAENSLAFRLIHTERNREYLKDTVSVPFLDLSAVIGLIREGEQGEYSYLALPSVYLREWETDARTLYEKAERNMQRLFPARVTDMEEFLKTMMPEGWMERKAESALPLSILTNDAALYGAGCMLYPGVLKAAAGRYGSDVLILPSSVHEVLLLPDTGEEIKTLEWMVRSINRTEVREEEILSDRVYRYERKTGKTDFAEKSGREDAAS